MRNTKFTLSLFCIKWMNVVGFALKKFLFVEMNNKQKADFIQANGQCQFFFKPFCNFEPKKKNNEKNYH